MYLLRSPAKEGERVIFFPFCFLFGDGKFKGQTRAKVRWPKKGVAEAFLLGGGSLQWGLWPKKYRKNIC